MGLAGHGLLLATRFTYLRARISLQTFKAAALPCSSGCGVLACVSVPENLLPDEDPRCWGHRWPRERPSQLWRARQAGALVPRTSQQCRGVSVLLPG